MIKLLCKKLDSRAKLPVRNNPTDSGVDVFALTDTIINVGETVVIKTGIAIQIWTDHVVGFDSLGGPVIDMDGRNYNNSWTYGIFAGHDKSGLGSKGLKVSAGVIDNPYTGEIGIVMNYLRFWGFITSLIAALKTLDFSKVEIGSYKFKAGDKVAQLIVQRVELPIVEEFFGEFGKTSRGALGYGSSGK